MTRRRRPPPDAIAPAGRVAGYVTAASSLGVGIAFLVPALPALNCTRGCTFSQHFAALIVVTTIGLAAVSIGIGWAIRRRPVEADGDTGWTWGLGVLFVLGMMLIASRVPRYLCPDGAGLDANVSICIDAVRFRRFPPSDRIWAKRAIIGVGWVLGLTVMRSPRWVWVAAPVAAAVWLLGAGWLLVDTFYR
jgi:hypothetical protein